MADLSSPAQLNQTVSDLSVNNRSRFSVEKDNAYEQAVARGVAKQLRAEKEHKS